MLACVGGCCAPASMSSTGRILLKSSPKAACPQTRCTCMHHTAGERAQKRCVWRRGLSRNSLLVVPCWAGWDSGATAVVSNNMQVRACGCTCRPARLQRAWCPPATAHQLVNRHSRAWGPTVRMRPLFANEQSASHTGTPVQRCAFPGPPHPTQVIEAACLNMSMPCQAAGIMCAAPAPGRGTWRARQGPVATLSTTAQSPDTSR